MTDPLAGEIALLELDAHRRGGGEAETLRLASAPVLTRSDDDPSSTDYAPDLRDGVHLAGLQLHDDSNGYLHLGGRIVVPELSAVTLANYAEPDGGAWRGRHDRMVDHVFDDRPVDVRTLPQERDADWQLRPAPFADAVSPDAPLVLAGLSFGGLASLHFAVAQPERVRALVLAGSGPGFKKAEAAARWKAQSERTADYLEERGLAAFAGGKAAATVIGRRPELPAARAARDAFVAQDAHGLAEFGRHVAGLAPSVIDDLAHIDRPALVVVGEEDAAYLQAAEVMAAKLPDARRRVVPGAGHILNIEEAAAFDALVLEFLSEIGALPASGGAT